MTEDTRFAHPVEREFARVLDEHGVAWEYEPVTFVLERNLDGTVHEAFTPDFYLPEQDVFIETTVMRQCLTTRKNRKVRKLRERHDVVVQILYRRDLVALARRWGLPALERAAGETFAGAPVPSMQAETRAVRRRFDPPRDGNPPSSPTPRPVSIVPCRRQTPACPQSRRRFASTGWTPRPPS